MIQLSTVARRSYSCRCGRPVFFRNSLCLGCKSPLGYEPDLGQLFPLTPTNVSGSWRIWRTDKDDSKTYRRCGNLDSVSRCNWLVNQQPDVGNQAVLCKSCRSDRTIPDLSVPENAACYARISVAKRRLVALLIDLGLPVASKEEDPGNGLSFDFLRSMDGGPNILTGHDNGVITLNVEEAEDATRERIRSEMGEPYRTLLGHLRHEVGHYYWGRLVADGPFLEDFRTLFGDERQDYASCLANHYRFGAQRDWLNSFVSAYASSHPWEDWAETWAHYLHIIDTLNTALSFGLDPDVAIEMEVEPFEKKVLFKPDDPDAAGFLELIHSWTLLTPVLNELSRAMGSADFYPFVLCERVIAKLQLIHLAACGGSRKERSLNGADFHYRLLVVTQTASRLSSNSSCPVCLP